MRSTLVNHMVCNQTFNSTEFSCDTYQYVSATEDFVTYSAGACFGLALFCFVYDYVKQHTKPKLVLPKWQV